MALVANAQSIAFAQNTTMTRDATGAVGTASTAAALVPGIGTTIAAILQTLSTFFGLIKGTTQHLTFQQVQAPAEAFEKEYYAKYISAYGSTNCIKILVAARANFLRLINEFWGPNTPGSKTALMNIQQLSAAYSSNPSSPTPLSWLLFTYVVWVGMNLDANAGEDTKAQYFRTLYDGIFTHAVTSLGLNAVAVNGAGNQGTGTPGGGVGSTDTGTGMNVAGFATGGIVVVLVGIALVVMLMRKG